MTVKMRTVLVCTGLSVVLTASVSQTQVRAQLTGAEIDEAIQAGVRASVPPFPMYPIDYARCSSGESPAIARRPACWDFNRPTDFGRKALALGRPAPAVVYTPFVRVALHARAADERGMIVTRADIPPAALEPTVWIGFTWNVCCGEIEERYRDGELTILAVFDQAAVRDMTSAAFVRATRDPRAQPLWTRQDTGPLRELGIEAPENIDALAAFPVDIATAAREFRLIRYSTNKPRSFAEIYVAPVPGDPRRWR